MAPHAKGNSHTKSPGRVKTEPKTLKRKREQEDLERLEKAISELDPKSPNLKKFTDLPLSEATASGLRQSHYEVCTDIQRHAIPLALQGKDVLGAARTGSGKTVAFLVPVLEKLYRSRWTEYDGLGALIISPTRELAIQIFEVLRKIGRNHIFSAGLVIGGKSMKEEADRLGRMNILVCTPGRILQHLDQTANFSVDNLQMLVLDEADRIMDMGFSSDVDALVAHLPKERQTLLFSATQSKRVADLARLSLQDPEYVSVHEAAETATPKTLQQSYLVTALPDKLNTLWGFIRSNLKKKMIVFLSSQKQVRFVYEGFRKLQPGVPLLHLHGGQKMEARLNITNAFQKAQYSCLFATDVVARGLDFPAVDWVVQADVPEDVDTYIHRVGRTARYESEGKAVLFLDPSELEFLKRLEHKKIPIQRVNVKDSRKKDITDQLQTLCFQNNDVKYLAQKAFISYTKSIYIQKDKDVFNLHALDLEGYSKSMGLLGAPQIKFQQGVDVKKLKNASRALATAGSDSEDSEADGEGGRRDKKDEVRTKHKKLIERQNQDVLSGHYRRLLGDEEDGDDGEDDFLSVKRVLGDKELDSTAGGGTAHQDTVPKVVTLGKQDFVVDSHRREKLLKSKKKLAKYMDQGQKVVFDDDGNARPVYVFKDEADFRKEGPADALRQQFVEGATAQVAEADVEDKELARQKRQEKKEKRKARERGGEAEEGGQQRHAVLPRLEAPEDEEDPLALLRSLPVAGGRSDSDEGEGEVDERPRKKARKARGEEEDGDERGARKKKRKVIEMEYEPETLEDFEALATGLLEE